VRCYSNISGFTGCNDYVRGRLPVTAISNASCPFLGSICKSHDKNLRLDTGYLDSLVHFGINAPPENRFLFRQVSHCAPLKLEGYTKFDNVSDPANPVMRYYYGELNAVDPTYGGFSYQQPVPKPSNTLSAYGLSQANYSIGCVYQ
jgi:hypothetical protein